MDQSKNELPFLDEEVARGLLDQLLEDSRLYKSSDDFTKLIEFTKRPRNFAPFNAMLLHVQKPGLTFAASAYDWKHRFERFPKEHARPLIILWPFGPVALVYDVNDTEGKELPQDVESFYARGPVTDFDIQRYVAKLSKKAITCTFFDVGDGKAGEIAIWAKATEKQPGAYGLLLNRNHFPATQFVTLAHELAHLFLGHLGKDRHLHIPTRRPLTKSEMEFEAESTAFLVSTRNGVDSRSHPYLSEHVTSRTTIDSIDLYHVMRAAGQIESILGLTSGMRYGPRPGWRGEP